MLNQLDLEDLVQRCRSANARAYVKEAVDCYRIGAYRACVITTWIALVYDIIDKLRELTLLGDTAAKKKVAEFDQIQKDRDTEAALEFERDVLTIAHVDFDLITVQEKSDLHRLYDDRNRCGHPNLNRESEVYTPPPELARLHLRVAIEHVLARPPVQGKAALTTLQAAVDSEFFPTDLEKAMVVLSGTALPRAKASVVSEFAMGGVVSCIREPLTEKQFSQRVAAVKVAQRLHPKTTTDTLRDKFDTALAKTSDSRFNKALSLLKAYPDLQPFVKDATWTTLETYVESLPGTQSAAILCALDIQRLNAVAVNRLNKFGTDQMEDVVTALVEKPARTIINRCLALYSNPESFDAANAMAKKLIIPLLPYFESKDAEAVILSGDDSQVKGSNQFPNVVTSIRKSGLLSKEEISNAVIKAGLRSKFPDLVIEEDDEIPE